MRPSARRPRSLILVPSLLLSCIPPLGAAENPYLYGIHDADPTPQQFLDRIKNGGAAGWVTASVAIGTRPDDLGGGDFTGLASQGHSVIVRLNNGYCPDGSIPSPDKYADFAKRASNYVASTQGADLFVIGNETNLSWEWPVVNGRQAYVSPQSYAQAYRMAYNEIKARRPGAKVLVQALAPFAGPYGEGHSCSGSIPADANPLNWVQYMRALLTAARQTGPIDGIALHVTSRGYSLGDIHSTSKMSAGGQDLYSSFYVYKDWIDLGIPSDLYGLPLYVTEANGYYFWKGGHPENPAAHYEAGWVQEVYAEINRYNQQAASSGKPIVHAVNLYRWCNWCDGWNIDSSQQFPNPYEGQILADLDQAVAAKYRWPGGTTPPPTPGGSNLARDAVAWEASSSYSASFEGDKAKDGVVSASSKWTSNGSSAESWLALDLGRTSDLTGFIVRHAGAAGELQAYNTQAFRLESGSSLSGPWTILATVSNFAQEPTSTVVLANVVTTRYVRLYVTDAGIDNYARIPELEVYGAPSSTPPPGPLVNGDFESGEPGGAVGTGWKAFTSSGYAAGFAVVSDQVKGGAFAQRVTSPQPSANDMYAGVYQAAATVAGQTYTVRAWNRTHFTGGNAWDHIARLGIDLTGGTHFLAPSVQWQEFDSAKDAWHLLERSVTATGTSMTIYLQSWRKWASGGDSHTWFDDVEVVPLNPPANHPPTAVVSANPSTGTAPLDVAFSGSGSSDPDGDPLTYGWSFGDGDQATGPTASHTYSAAGSYTAGLTVDDGRGGTNSANVTITVSPGGGNRPPRAAISASPRTGTIPFTVTLDGTGSTDPDGDPLTYNWSFADGIQGSGPTLQRAFVDANGDMKEAGGYLVTLTVSDGKGGTGSASVRIGVFPPGCPSSLDFDAIRAQLDAQGQDLEFVKVGFHTGGGGTFTGLGLWERCLDAAGVPFTVKQVPSAHNASVGEAALLKARSGVPHTIVYRKCCNEYELPACALADWNTCTDDIAQQQAEAHWQRHLQAFPPEVVDNRQSIWVETINEPWKGSSTRNNAEWLAKFSYYTALQTMAAGYNYAAFGWSTGEPQYGPRPPDEPLAPEFQWDGPEMQNFLRLAAQHPDRIAISLHEYDLTQPTLRQTYPDSIGRVQKLFERCDANGIGRPTVLITEFGWPAPPPIAELLSPDNVPWAAGLYAALRPVKGVALWDAGNMSSIISGITAYALQNYFAIPKEGPTCPITPLPTPEDRWKLEIWNNRQMSGAPVEVRLDATGEGGFRFPWGAGRASQCTGSDNFAVRFSRRGDFAATAEYVFRVTADDGVRLFVDGELILDKGQDQAPTTYEARKLLTAGPHDLRVDYYENAGGAFAELSWAAAATSCVAVVPTGSWRGEYFNNKALGGNPLLVRDDGNGSLAFDWGSLAPSGDCGLPADNFSASWTRMTPFDAGRYRFTVTVDDGVRLYVDGVLRLEKWLDQAPTSYDVDLDMTAGEHTIRMEYYENGGGAVAKLSWRALSPP